MDRSKPETIDQLLQAGLDHYGLGEVEEAVRSWRQVLVLEPEHPRAREYLETAVEAETPAPRAPRNDAAELVREALRLFREDQLEEALKFLEGVAGEDPDRLDVHGYLEMVRSRLLKRYRDQLGNRGVVPRLRLPREKVTKFNLPPDAGFLLSLIDGVTSVADLVSVCGMDEFQALRIFTSLLDAGIVEIPQ